MDESFQHPIRLAPGDKGKINITLVNSLWLEFGHATDMSFVSVQTCPWHVHYPLYRRTSMSKQGYQKLPGALGGLNTDFHRAATPYSLVQRDKQVQGTPCLDKLITRGDG